MYALERKLVRRDEANHPSTAQISVCSVTTEIIKYDVIDLRAFIGLGRRANESTRCLGTVESTFTGLKVSQDPAFVLGPPRAKKERPAKRSTGHVYDSVLS